MAGGFYGKARTADKDVALGEVTERVGDALGDICRSLHNLQGLIAPLVLEAAARDPVHLREFQEFDHLSQKLKNIADFLAALSAAAPDDWRLDPRVAAKVVTLGELSAHLSFADRDTAAQEPGDFELFN